jgi:hypothetical protein
MKSRNLRPKPIISSTKQIMQGHGQKLERTPSLEETFLLPQLFLAK